MVDNVAITEGSGDKTVRSDDIGGFQWQCVKIGLGADGTANFWTVGTGNVDVGTPRMTLADDDPAVAALQGTLTVGGTVTANLGTIAGVATEATLATIASAIVTSPAPAMVVDASGYTVPVSVASLPLPTGAATEATLSALNTKFVGGTTIGDVNVNGTVPVSGTFWQATQPVSAASLPLPTGAATETTVDAVKTAVETIAGAVVTSPTSEMLVQVTGGSVGVSGSVGVTSVPADPFGLNADAASSSGSISAKLRFIASTGIPITGTVVVDGSAVTQPISAVSLPLPSGAATEASLASIASTVVTSPAPALVVDASGYTVPISAASLPLPAGAATESTLSTLNTKFVGGTTIGDVNVNGTVPVSGTFWQATQPVSGTFWQATQPVSAATLPLPTGAAAETTLAAVRTAIEIIDDWDETNRAAVNPVVGQAGLAGGTGVDAANALRVSLATDIALPSGDNNIGNVDVASVADQYDEYETVAANQTAQVLGPSGLVGDFISGILVIPATTSPGNVILLDGATSITVFTGGASSVSNLVPFLIPLGMSSVNGSWQITTGADVSCIGIGRFT